MKQRYPVPDFDTKLGYYPYHIPFGISFEKFVQIIIKIPDYLADNHFKSQYAILSDCGKLLPDFIGHMETIQQDWEKLAKTYNFDLTLAHLHSTGHQKKTSYSNYYTQALADLVYQRYQKDFELLEYHQARQELLQDIENNLHKK